MKKLLLSVLLAWPIVGLAGGGEFSYKTGQVYYVDGLKCEIISAYVNPNSDKPSQTLICRRVIVPGILYRDYEIVVPDLDDLAEPYIVGDKWVSISKTAKYTIIGAALTGAAYYIGSNFFPEQMAELKKAISIQKDNFVKVISPITNSIRETVSPIFNKVGQTASPVVNRITSTVSPVFDKLSENATAGLSAIGGRINSLFATKK